ncbi:MAG: MmcQ/YjbR family DNA-binding protein [Rhodospirillaceae bacterium]|nr:MmcQ/YjbR family DNA-binding protein [Rhodospirillaceae bacterium]
MTAKKKAKKKEILTPTIARRDKVAAKLRAICLKLPEVTEGVSFGNIAFKAGKRPFVVLDRYKGVDCIFLYVDPGLRGELLRDKRFFAAPYDPREKGLCRTLSALDWKQMMGLILFSYRSVALARMLAALDAKKKP